MKKLLSLVLVLCMVATGCVIFSSCAKVSASDFEKHPAQAVGDAVSNTFTNFFEDQVGFIDVLEKIKDKSSVELGFDCDEELFGEALNAKATIYSDTKEKDAVVDAEVTFRDEKYAARLYASPTDFAFASKSILGNDDTLLVNIDTFIEKFAKSDLAGEDMADLDDDEIAAIIKLAEFIREEGKKSAKDVEKENQEIFDNFFLKLGQTVETEKLENADGKNTNCIVVTYAITEETLTDALSYLVTELYKDMDFVEDLDLESAEDIVDEIEDALKEVNVSIDVKMYIAKKTNSLAKLTVDVKVEDFKASAEMTFTEEQIAVSVDVKEMDVKVNLTIDKKVDGDKIDYDFAVKAETKNFTLNVLEATLETNKDGAFSLTASIPNFDELEESEDGELKEAGDRYTATLSGKASADKETATIEFNKVTVKAGEFDKEFKFNFYVKVTADADVPAIPDGAKDVVDFSKDDWEKLVEDIKGSDLVKNLSDMF